MGKKKIILIVLISVLLTGFIALMISLDKIFAVYSPSTRAVNLAKTHSLVYFDNKPYRAKKTTNYILVGIDSEGPLVSSKSYTNTDLNDFICILSFDHSTKTFFLLPINRDTMCYVDEYGLTGRVISSSYRQIAYAHTEGDGLKKSFQNTLNSASKLLFDLDIERFAGFTMSAIPIVNEYIGNVDITLDEDLSEIDPSWTKGATIVLTKDNCMQYIRARQEVGDGTNISRMNRQKVYINRVIEKVKEGSYNIREAMTLIDDYTCSNMVNGDYLDLRSWLNDYTYAGTYQIEGTATSNNGLIEFVVDEEKLKDLVKNLFYDPIE